MALTKIDDRGLKTPIDLLDNEKIRLGTGNDLQIYHDGNNSWLDNSTGDYYIRNTSSNDHVVVQAGLGGEVRLLVNAGENAIRAYTNGAVELYHDNSKKLQTTANGIEITAAEGGSAGLYLTADEGDDNGDKWSLYADDGSTISLVNYASGSWEKSIECNGNGNVELYYDNSKKLETTSSGVLVSGHLDLNDGNNIKLGSGDDLQIYHDGSDSYIVNQTGSLYIIPKLNENGIQLVPDGTVRLYYDNAARFETTSAGATVKTLGDTVLTLLADSDNNNSNNWPVIDFRINNTSGNAEARIAYREDTAALKFDIAGSEKVGVNQYGLVFNADTAAANALDDYEEGQWTPQLHDGSISYQEAYYTKIGRQVTITARLYNFSDNSTNDALRIKNLPFVASITSVAAGSVMYSYGGQSNATVLYLDSAHNGSLNMYGGHSGAFDNFRHNELNVSSQVTDMYIIATYSTTT